MSYEGERSALEQDAYEEMIRMRTPHPSPARFDGSRPEPPYPTAQSDASLRNAERTRSRELLATFMLQHGLATGHADTIEDLLVELGGQIGELQHRAVTLPWIPTTDRLPEKPGKASYEYVECAIFYKGEFLIRPWNCEHLCWDDEAHDDFFCNPLDPTHWMELRAP